MTFLEEIIAFEAKKMIRELRENPMLVVLLPAPDPQHTGHCIRAVISRPPGWYMDRFYHSRGRKTFKRQRFLRALQRVVEGKPVLGNYQLDIVNFIKESL